MVIPGSAPALWTMRTAVDDDATFTHVKSWLSPSCRLVIASMTAEQAPLIRQIIEAQLGEIILLPTRSQCLDRDKTLALAKSCRFVQLNQSELEVWSGITGDVIAGINWLRSRQVASVIVTAGVSGIFAHLAGQWEYASAFNIDHLHDANPRCERL